MRQMIPTSPSRRSLLTTTALLLTALPTHPVFAQETLLLDPILVENAQGPLTSSDEGSGATVLDAEAMEIRGNGSGDANSALTTLPRVQYQTLGNGDAGQNSDDVLDLQPQELSISGGSVSENTILLNGINISSPYGSSAPKTKKDLSRTTGVPKINAYYGLHAQSQFIPSSFVEEATVLDSSVSAKYGGFQGGVVKYEMAKPDPTEPSGAFSIGYSTSDWSKYKLGTKNGQNPEDQAQPEWSKLEYAVHFNQPLDDTSAVRFSYSRRSAEGTKPLDPQYVQDWADNDSRSDFYNLSYLKNFDNGGTLTLTGSLTDYDQGWDSDYTYDYHMDVKSQNLSLDATYEKDWDSLSFAGLDLSDAKLRLLAVYQDNDNSNDDSEDTYFGWYGSYKREGFTTDAFEDWCTADPTASETVACRTGGVGSETYADRQKRVEAELTGQLWGGDFAMGAALSQIDAQHSGSGYTYYSRATRLKDADVFDEFICADGDPACLPDQYFYKRTVVDPYDVTVSALKAEAYAELEHSWGNVTLRAGLRADYNDVMENLDLAPRLSARWTPSDDFELTVGANRYYSDNYMAYAIHDATPRGIGQERTHDATTGEVGDWSDGSDNGNYSYAQSDLKTPFTDELSVSMMYRDSWTQGTWRLTGLYREGKDQFASSGESSSVNQTLTNDGSSEYKSVSLEYENNWEIGGPSLDSLGVYVSGVWAERHVTNNTYFYDSDEALNNLIAYHDESYLKEAFKQVTGNLDIPVRATFELRSSWKQDRFGLGLGADVTFGYDGVRDSGRPVDLIDPATGREASHDLFEDYKFETMTSVFLTARAQVAEVHGSTVTVNLKIDNLFNDTGSREATDANPWIEGRSVYLGTSVEW
nr:TonB-dependent receptor plug domain-containing protein [uncultured Celeribacter sp.]